MVIKLEKTVHNSKENDKRIRNCECLNDVSIGQNDDESNVMICDLEPFVKLKKREKHPWRSATSSKVAGF